MYSSPSVGPRDRASAPAQVHPLQISFLAEIEAWLSKEPDMSADQLKATVEAIRLMPQTLRKHIPNAAKEAAQRFPHDPGGHPKSIKDEKWPEIYVEILESIGNGKNEREALKIAAKKNKVSLKTIQRGWRRRGQTDGQTLIKD